MQISIIVPSFNGVSLLKQALPSIRTLADVLQEVSEIIIVDNGSSDGSVDLVSQAAEQDPRINLITLPENRGSTGAINAGAAAATGTHLLLLNNDCQIAADVLQQLIDRTQQVSDAAAVVADADADVSLTDADDALVDPDTALVAVQPVVQSPDGSIENAGFVMDKRIAKAEPITDLADPRLCDAALSRWDDHQELFFGLSATCLLIDRAVFVKIGGLDESFHSYLEDVDLSIRLARAGLRYAVVTSATVVHQHMATSTRMGRYKQTRDLLNWMRIITNHYSLMLMVRYVGPLLIERLRNLSGWLKG